MLFFDFFFTDTAPTEIYTLSLHDALPILNHGRRGGRGLQALGHFHPAHAWHLHIEQHDIGPGCGYADIRSEEHTSELQSRENLVCRLLLEKKKKKKK